MKPVPTIDRATALRPAALQLEVHTPERARLRIQPLERGVGITLGAALRHVLLTQLSGLRLDAWCTPVRRVWVEVEPIRVGPRTDCEGLRLDVETDGSLAADEALRDAVRRLSDGLAPLAGDTSARAHAAAGVDERTRRELAGLLRPLDELALPLRTLNALAARGIRRVGDLVRCTERELLQTAELGRRRLAEIGAVLAERGLTLGMVVPGWPPRDERGQPQ